MNRLLALVSCPSLSKNNYSTLSQPVSQTLSSECRPPVICKFTSEAHCSTILASRLYTRNLVQICSLFKMGEMRVGTLLGAVGLLLAYSAAQLSSCQLQPGLAASLPMLCMFARNSNAQTLLMTLLPATVLVCLNNIFLCMAHSWKQ